MAGQWEPVSGVYWSTAPLLPSLDWIWNLGNSSFFTTVFGALAGAFAGAWAAQRIAARSKLQDELLKEIRSVNSAIMLAFSIFSIGVAMKRDAAKPLKAAYEKELELFRTSSKSEIASKLSEKFNIEKITCVGTPIETLKSLVLSEISTPSTALRAFLRLDIAIGSNQEALENRNDIIDIFIREDFPADLDFFDIYFGEPRKGLTYRAYKDSIYEIHKTTDAIIFHSHTLCEKLSAHGEKLLAQHKKVSKKKLAISKLAMSEEIRTELFPDEEEYLEWKPEVAPAQPVAQRKWWQRQSIDQALQ